MKQKYTSMRLRVEDRRNIIRRKSDGRSFGKGLIIRLDEDSPENYEEVPMEEHVLDETDKVESKTEE